MGKFVNYEGKEISVPTHTHLITDTQRNNTTAYATTTNPGFVTKDEISDIDILSLLIEGVEINNL